MTGFQPPHGSAGGTLDYAGGRPSQTTSGVAIASLVLGILAILTGCFGVGILLGIVAIILGGIGISKTGDPSVKGRGMAIAGLACGCVSIVLILPLMIGILVPSLNRAREAANRVACASNLRQIGQAMRQYAIDDVEAGRFPPDLETLYAVDGTMVPDTFVCPTSNAAAAPPPFALGRNLSYVYLGDGLTDAGPATTPVAHCETHNHRGEGTNVLYLDGSARFEEPTAYPPAVTATANPSAASGG